MRTEYVATNTDYCVRAAARKHRTGALTKDAAMRHLITGMRVKRLLEIFRDEDNDLQFAIECMAANATGHASIAHPASSSGSSGISTPRDAGVMTPATM